MGETREFHRPDGAAMEALLDRHRDDPTGIVLRLAWRQGLSRDEIARLSWRQVDPEGGALRLEDREVPLEPETAEALERWRRRCERFSPYVAVSDRLRRHMAPQSLTALARAALDSAGMEAVRLIDLRFDYCRRQFLAHDWPYALRVTGVSLTSYRNGLPWLEKAPAPPAAPPERTAPAAGEAEELRLWRVLQAERRTPAGVALWLVTQLGLRAEDCAALTWDRIDFDRDALLLGGRALPLRANLRLVLWETRAGRAPDADPHVLLTPRSGRPLTPARLTTLVRAALIRGGIEDKSLVDLRREAERDGDRRAILDYAAARGSVTRGEVMELLGLSEGQAYRRLLALLESGALVRSGNRCYPAGTVVTEPTAQRETVLRFVGETGSARRQDVAEALHLDPRRTGRLLKRLVADGDLVLHRDSQRYTLAK